MKLMKVNKKEMVDVVIAALTVKNAPQILGLVAPGTFTTGTTGTIMGGVLGYVVGMLLKKPTVSNVSLAIAVANVVQDIAISPAVGMIAPSAAGLSSRANYPRLAEYVRQPRSSQNYAKFYN